MTGEKHHDTASPLGMEESPSIEHREDTPQTTSASFRPAYADEEFLLKDELRPLRFQLELLKPELLQKEQGIESTVVVFGSTRIPDPAEAAEAVKRAQSEVHNNPSDAALRKDLDVAKRIQNKTHYYEKAREFGRLITEQPIADKVGKAVIVTGSGGGIMEAANRGAYDAGGKSIGLNIIIPREQYPNRYVTPELCFQFQYFALRKMHFLLRAIALVVFPGGYGTMDELFETLTLIQTRKMQQLPVLIFGREYWERIINFEMLVEEGVIDESEFDLFQFVDSPEEAVNIIRAHYSVTRE